MFALWGDHEAFASASDISDCRTIWASLPRSLTEGGTGRIPPSRAKQGENLLAGSHLVVAPGVG